VIGASTAKIWTLLSKEFLVLVVISLIIAFPVAYYFMNDWIQKYTYHAGFSWWIFAVTGVGALLITILTVSYQTIRAAFSNMVKSLRSE
jgi:putative ABC transport system permease protein